MGNVVRVGGSSLDVVLKSGAVMTLRPVPMKRMPSASPHDWLRFQGAHVAGTQMSDETIAKVQLFMRAKKTEALSDGTQCLTVAGDRFALCDPDAIQ